MKNVKIVEFKRFINSSHNELIRTKMKIEQLVNEHVKKYKEGKDLWEMRKMDLKFYEVLKIAEPNAYKRLQYETMYETNKRLI